MVYPNPLEESLALRLRTAGSVFAEAEARLLAAEAWNSAALESMVSRRTAGEPLEQVLGWAEFFGLRVAVAPGVFVPRRRTELLAARTIALLAAGTDPLALPAGSPNQVVAELCCGSAAVSMAITRHAPTASLFAVDIDPAAVRCARRNLDEPAVVLQGDLYEALPAHLRGGIDVVVANAPYVPSAQLGTMPPEARDHEPALTLDGGVDGLDIQRRIIDEAPVWLRPGGTLLLECSERQAPMVGQLMTAAGFVPEILHWEDPDATAASGRWSPCTARTPG
ncbi:putative protein N(5)-glutamine methyltransferase [Arthrobacter jiangjiafuii]|uniref:peptide chain release factor N(5)-glutamine methyltransferase n=1 Tax=Arthrobacter jiangjiafuii TaxID=2817475 RepID=A0A975M7T1_9MICC|nr:putative protein N(5)-glutamine methyltransferase [Arthrobacter jiangjiafuii]MBP3043035.1 putative protein N(5)-glutamine methyltransferase [Arthrobacter jiangjiafuii]QWC11551.1 putative protein N(5)-glutamine methyltransferase [Arthrobacter jiangjiafuii]